MNEQDEFLFKEYSTAIQLIFHIDDLRYKLTTLFLSIASIGAAGVAILSRGDNFDAIESKIILGIFLFMAGMIGGLIVIILGRLRRHQIEHYRICDKIRNYFFKCNYILWNIVEKSEITRPKPTRGSAPYYWLLIIIVVGSFMLGLSICFFVLAFSEKLEWNFKWYYNIPIFIFIFWFAFRRQRKLYFRKAETKKEEEYKDTNPPFIQQVPVVPIIENLP